LLARHSRPPVPSSRLFDQRTTKPDPNSGNVLQTNNAENVPLANYGATMNVGSFFIGNNQWVVGIKGFGESFRLPLRLQDGLVQAQPLGSYRLDRTGDQWILWQYADGDWQPQYRFDLQARDLADFSAMCHYHQTSHDSHFTQQRICTLATPTAESPSATCD